MDQQNRIDLALIEKHLRACRELSALAVQNGWIDNDSLQIEVIESRDRSALVSVKFDEFIMKGGTGCAGTRMPRFGTVMTSWGGKEHFGPLGRDSSSSSLIQLH